MRQHAAHRRARRGRDRVRQRGAPVVPHSARSRRRLVPARAVHRGGQGALRDLARARGARAHRVRARRHQDDGVLGVLPHRVGPRALRALAGHPRRSGPGERGGFVRRLLPAHRRHRPDQVRPAVRAVPQPGPQADARHRHGLRLSLPRRDDQVRGRALRVGPRRADRHLLHHQGAGRGARLRARARLPVPRGRQDRQAHAAAHHGPRHAVARVLREGHRPRRRLQDGHRAAHALRVRSRRQARHRRRPRPRRPPPPGRHPRRRRRHHARSAHRVPPDPAQAGSRRAHRGRADRHPVRDARGRRPRPPQDGLPGAAQPRRPRDRARPHRREHRRPPRHRPRPARRPGHLRPAPPRRHRGRVPARRRTHARAAAFARAHRVRGRRRAHRPVPPGSDGAELAQRVRRPQERSQAGHATPTKTCARCSSPPTG